MRFICTSGRLEEFRADTIVVFTPSFEKITDRTLKALDRATRGALTILAASKEFHGKEGETAVLLKPQGFRAGRVLLAGLGDSSKVDADCFRRAAGVVSRHKSLAAGERAVFHACFELKPAYAQALVEGYLLGSYVQVNFKTLDGKKDKQEPSEITVSVTNWSQLPACRQSAQRGQIIADGQNLVRALAFTPSNKLTPRLYVRRIQELAKKHRLTCRILDENGIARERMRCLQAVARGSAEPPRFAILHYKGRRDNQKPVLLVGKGVTFDAGGISLKPAQDMHEMKGDMTGSAIVLSALVTASRLKLPVNLVALMPLTENMPSGTALKPGDVVTSRKGLTIDIVNTDAEGRLILADALDFANTFKPQAVVDIATLTGAALYVLGYAGAPIVGNNPELMDRLRQAAAATAERVWEMPMWDDFREAMKGTVADLVNSGGRPAGTLTASAFLGNFIGDWPWAHIDIAYVDLEKAGKPYMPKGATGFGLRLLVEMLSQWKTL
ncbi:MAG: leucyl aminopeptidase [Candidatus Zixiibacteriota bacterium]